MPLLHQLPVDPDQFTDDPLLDDVQYVHIMSFQWDFFNVGSTVDNLMAIFAPNRSGRTRQVMDERTKGEVERCFWEQIEPMSITNRIECLNQVIDILLVQSTSLDALITRHTRVWRRLRAEWAAQTIIDSVAAMYKVLKRVELCVGYYNGLFTRCRESHVNLLNFWERPLSCDLRQIIESQEEILKIREVERQRPMKFHSCNQLCEHETGRCSCQRYRNQAFDEKLCFRRQQAWRIDEGFWMLLKETEYIRRKTGNKSYPKLMECINAWRARKEAEQRIFNYFDYKIEESIRAEEKRVSGPQNIPID
ncbi:hypothetical protein BDZ45DRAFT_683599 [Acephala macrosclerotiorum]|nr:hypothetical protein BDZ45DRAFT_683599 [Acephala macrosclerotiorum]